MIPTKGKVSMERSCMMQRSFYGCIQKARFDGAEPCMKRNFQQSRVSDVTGQGHMQIILTASL